MKNLLSWIITLLPSLVGLISPEIRSALTELLRDLKAKAKNTPNQFDDIMVDFLAALLSIEL